MSAPNQLRNAAAVIVRDVLTTREILDSKLLTDTRYLEALSTVANGARALADLATAIERGELQVKPVAPPITFGDLDGGELLGIGAR